MRFGSYEVIIKPTIGLEVNMIFPNQPVQAIKCWHAHIYYQLSNTREIAAALRQKIMDKFSYTTIGRWHDEAVGPHLVSMYQVAFKVEHFDPFVQWLTVNRDGLSILVHPNTENAYNDHLIFGFWLGDKLPLNEDRLVSVSDRKGK